LLVKSGKARTCGKRKALPRDLIYIVPLKLGRIDSDASEPGSNVSGSAEILMPMELAANSLQSADRLLTKDAAG